MQYRINKFWRWRGSSEPQNRPSYRPDRAW